MAPITHKEEAVGDEDAGDEAAEAEATATATATATETETEPEQEEEEPPQEGQLQLFSETPTA